MVYTPTNGISWRPAGAVAAGLANVTGYVSNVAAAAGPAGHAIVGRVVEPDGGCLADVWFSPNLATWTRTG